jgi:hypothetical protein
VGKAISPGSGADGVGGGAGGAGTPGIGADYYIKCPQCHKGYPGFQALKEHVESCHPPPPHLGAGDDVVSQPTSPVGSPTPNSSAPGVGYACSQCNTSFLHKDQLEQHELVHSPNAQVVSIVFLNNTLLDKNDLFQLRTILSGFVMLSYTFIIIFTVCHTKIFSIVDLIIIDVGEIKLHGTTA